jgi:hypothetical protein
MEWNAQHLLPGAQRSAAIVLPARLSFRLDVPILHNGMGFTLTTQLGDLDFLAGLEVLLNEQK